jgi:hypothetical protein
MIQFFHNTFLTLGCQSAGLPQCSAGIAWHNIVGLGAAVYCAWVVRGSLLVGDTKRGLSNDAGSRGRLGGFWCEALGGSPFG